MLPNGWLGYVTVGCGSECSHLIGAAQVEVNAAELHGQVWPPPNSLPSEKVDCHFLCDWAEWKCWHIQMTLPEPHYCFFVFFFSKIYALSCDCCAVNITGRLMIQTLQPRAHRRVRCHICSAKKGLFMKKTNWFSSSNRPCPERTKDSFYTYTVAEKIHIEIMFFLCTIQIYCNISLTSECLWTFIKS